VEELPVIMVVEDDHLVQTMVEAALVDGGFEPAIAASGEEAVTLLKGGLTKYRALVTDINLRGSMEGWEVARQAREIDPEFPIVYMTGLSAEEYGSKGVPNSILLNKPFAPAQLVHRRFPASECRHAAKVSPASIGARRSRAYLTVSPERLSKLQFHDHVTEVDPWPARFR